MNKPTVYILVGVPASGKSTWYNNQTLCSNAVYVSTDYFVDQYAERVNQTYNEVFKSYMPTAVRLMTRVVVEARCARQDIIWDQTSTTVASRAKKLRMLPEYRTVAVVFPTPTVVEHARRLDARPGKSIPPLVIRSMIDGLVTPTCTEGFDKIIFINH